MSVDVMQIGLRHDLPVHDPFATAEVCSKRLKSNIKLLAEDFYRYDEKTNSLGSLEDHDFVELAFFRYDDSEYYSSIIVKGYQRRQLLETVGMEKLKTANFLDERAKRILEEEYDNLYEFSLDYGVEIYQENVDLWIYVSKWFSFYEAFCKQDKQWLKWLRKCRKEIQNMAKAFGCKEIIICPDTGIGEDLRYKMDMSSDELLSYVKEMRYLNWMTDDEKEEHRKYARHINYGDYVNGGLHLEDKEWVDIVFDRVEE